MNLRLFLRLQTDTYLENLRDSIATDLSENREYISISLGGKSSSMKKMVNTVKLATALAEVLLERNLGGSDYKEMERMTHVRFV